MFMVEDRAQLLVRWHEKIDARKNTWSFLRCGDETLLRLTRLDDGWMDGQTDGLDRRWNQNESSSVTNELRIHNGGRYIHLLLPVPVSYRTWYCCKDALVSLFYKNGTEWHTLIRDEEIVRGLPVGLS